MFDDSGSNVLDLSDVVTESHLEMISEERRLLSLPSEVEQVETDVDHSEAKEDTPAAEARGSSEKIDSKTVKTDVGIIISIDEDNSILNVMPLTPRTRDRITRSDLFLDEEGRAALRTPQGMKVSKSSQGLCKRSLHRLPSVEHLDRPVRMKRSSSDYTVHKDSSSKHFLQPASAGRRWSFFAGRKADKGPEEV